MTTTRTGLTVPLDAPLHAQPTLMRSLADAGYSDVWSSESDGADAVTPLVIAAVSEPRLRLGTAILPAFTRGPACLAQTVASLADTATAPVAIGIGASSRVVVEHWNAIPFEHPYQRVRDTLDFLRRALTGEKITTDYASFSIKGFRLSRVPEQPPQLLVAALQQRMLELAGRDSDGVILNWLSAADVERVAEIVNTAAKGQAREVVARILVCPSTHAETVRANARRLIAGYLTVPTYSAYQRWLGREPVLRPMWEAWARGDRKTALAAIPDAIVDELVIHGSPDACRTAIEQYRRSGVTTVVLALPPLDPDLDQLSSALALAPAT